MPRRERNKVLIQNGDLKGSCQASALHIWEQRGWSAYQGPTSPEKLAEQEEAAKPRYLEINGQLELENESYAQGSKSELTDKAASKKAGNKPDDATQEK